MPVARYNTHKVPMKLMQPVKEVLTTMQAEGIIEPVTTPTDGLVVWFLLLSQVNPKLGFVLNSASSINQV